MFRQICSLQIIVVEKELLDFFFFGGGGVEEGLRCTESLLKNHVFDDPRESIWIRA